MAHQVQGVVAASRGAPVQLTTITVPDPGPGEALVRVQACGVCHTDLHYREGAINDDFPFLLGHEAAGVVESVGPGVDNVAPGDFVIIAWRAPCGACRSCARGRPWYCFASRNAAQPMTLPDGTPLSPALGIGAFTELTLIAAGQAVKVPAGASPAAAGLIGCGIMAGLGAAVNTGSVSRGDSVAVFGCGGVGDAAIAGSQLAGAHTIIAIDIDDRKLEWGPRIRRNPHHKRPQHRPGGSGAPSHRRQRRQRYHRSRREPYHLRAGFLRPRPCRYGRPGRGAQPRYAD